MPEIKIAKNYFDLSKLDKILRTRSVAETLLSKVKESSIEAIPTTDIDTNDKDIEILLKINDINWEFNEELEEIEQPLEEIVEICDDMIDPIYSVIDTFNFKYIDVDEPSYNINKKANRFIGAGAVFTAVCLLSIALSLAESAYYEAFLALILMFVPGIILLIGLIRKRVYKKKLAEYHYFQNVILAAEKKQYIEKCLTKLMPLLVRADNSFAEFTTNPPNSLESNLSFYENKHLSAIAKHKEKLTPYVKKYNKFINDPSLLYDCIEVLSDKRAKTFSKVLSEVKSDRDMSEIKEYQRQQAHYARQAAYHAERQSEHAQETAHYAREAAYQAERQSEYAQKQAIAAEKSARAEQERTDEIKRALRK